MKINNKKSKIMIFNPPRRKIDFLPEIKLDKVNLEVVDEFKLLGVIVKSDLTWKSNTDYITKKAYSRLWILRRLKEFGASQSDLIEIYKSQVRSILEFAVPVWASYITKSEKNKIERVQKCALAIIQNERYKSYTQALSDTKLEFLEDRRQDQLLKFARKSLRHPKFKNWFEINKNIVNTRSQKTKFKKVTGYKKKLEKSPIGYMTEILNNFNK